MHMLSKGHQPSERMRPRLSSTGANFMKGFHPGQRPVKRQRQNGTDNYECRTYQRYQLPGLTDEVEGRV